MWYSFVLAHVPLQYGKSVLFAPAGTTKYVQRLEANIQPENLASLALVRKLDIQRQGYFHATCGSTADCGIIEQRALLADAASTPAKSDSESQSTRTAVRPVNSRHTGTALSQFQQSSPEICATKRPLMVLPTEKMLPLEFLKRPVAPSMRSNAAKNPPVGVPLAVSNTPVSRRVSVSCDARVMCNTPLYARVAGASGAVVRPASRLSPINCVVPMRPKFPLIVPIVHRPTGLVQPFAN